VKNKNGRLILFKIHFKQRSITPDIYQKEPENYYLSVSPLNINGISLAFF